MFPKSECKADCHSPEPIKSIRYFCKHNKMVKNYCKPLKLPFNNISRKLCHSFMSNFFETYFKILQQFIVNQFLLLFPPANWRNFIGNVSYNATLSGKAGEKFCLCNFEYKTSMCVRDFKNSHFCKGGRQRHSRRGIVV